MSYKLTLNIMAMNTIYYTNLITQPYAMTNIQSSISDSTIQWSLSNI